jgi:arabinofuranosyltransferase
MAAYVATLSIQHPKKIVSTLAIAAAPVIIWTGFSLFYYGFPLPNTAYAKLGAGIAMNERIAQGIKYLLHGVDRDPVTVFVLASGIALGLRGSRLSQSISVGVLLYLMYIVYIGGDFMEGRFLTAPFFMSLIIFAREINTSSLAIGLAAPVLIFGATSMHANVLSGSSYSNTDIPDNGIADERGYYFAKFGMLTARGNTFTPPPWKVSDRSVDVICGELGFTSIRKGPGMHYIDDCGLTDPLLARLPALSTPDWRIGHFFRQLPTGYEESLIQGKNLVLDTKTRAYWQSVRTVTRNSLFDSKRFTEIIRLNFNLVEKPNWQLYQTTIIPRSSSLRLETESRLKTIRTEGADWNAMGNFVFEDTLDIVLDQKTDIRSIDVSVDNNDVYHISGFRNDELVPLATITSRHTTGLARHTIVLKDTVGDVERVRVTAESGDGMYSIGHLIVNDR